MHIMESDSLYMPKKVLQCGKDEDDECLWKMFSSFDSRNSLSHLFYACVVHILSVSFSNFCLLVLFSLFSLGLTQALALVSCLKKKVQLQRQKLL